MTKGITAEGEFALFCSKCDSRLEDTVGRVGHIQEEETFDSDLYHVFSYAIDLVWFVMNGLEDTWDVCPRCSEEVNP